MSIAGHTSCTATVASKVECQFVKLNFNELNGSEFEGKNEVIMMIYKSISEILAKKLVMTNSIAKTFKEKLAEKNSEDKN